MFTTLTASLVARRVRPVLTALAVAAAALSPLAAAAQSLAPALPPTVHEVKPNWEFLVASGNLRPTGAVRDEVSGGGLTAAQLSYVPRPTFAITSTIGWARTQGLAAPASSAVKLDLFTYDLGAEFRAPRWRSHKALSFSPLVGGGVGARTYRFRGMDLAATQQLGAYVSAGGEFGVRRVRVRLEVRDYLTGFRSVAGAADARNDLAILTGIRFVK